MQQQKQKIPVRRCVGCNAQRPKRELVRVVRSPEGEISMICAAKRRGAAPTCAPRPPALPKRARQSGWNARLRFPIPDGIYDRLTEETPVRSKSAKEAASDE